MSDVLVVGCGLLGTSLGLALQGSALGDVTLLDQDPAAQGRAIARGAGRAWDGVEKADLVVVAVPPGATASVMVELQRLNVGHTYTHVSSVQSHVQDEIERLSPDSSRVVGGHPLAGREVSGPDGALADLFVGRPWAICPGPAAAGDAVAAVHSLARACAAEPLAISAQHHDDAVALLSHLPQVVSSALAGALTEAGAGLELATGLSGSGLADTTRLAASSPALWVDILQANAARIAPTVARVAQQLQSVSAALDVLSAPEVEAGAAASARAVIEDLLRRGNEGRSLVPIKRGETSRMFRAVRVALADQPGQLASLLLAAGAAGVNVEDVRVEHVPGRATGIIDLLVDEEQAEPLKRALGLQGWQVVEGQTV